MATNQLPKTGECYYRDVKAWVLLAIGEMFANREASAERPAVAHGFADRLLDPFRAWGV